MMGHQPPLQDQLFYHNINLDRRIRADHPLRQIDKQIDFDFVYAEVQDKYGSRGNVSVPPPVILKLMLLLVFYNVRSERELLATLPERLDWLWFLGLDLDSEIPNHSVLSKARSRWGEVVFRSFFERIVWQCVEAGLVDANASNDSVVERSKLKPHLNLVKCSAELMVRLNEEPEGTQGETNQRYVSTTDPDATLVRRGESKLRYQVHRAVDGRAEVITATTATTGVVNEAHKLDDLVQAHNENTQKAVQTVVADSKYGTIENYLHCHDQGLAAHIPDMGRKRREGFATFPDSDFRFDNERDVYYCPTGEIMKRKAFHKNRNTLDYAAPRAACQACALRAQCTKNKAGRTVTRHLRQQTLSQMRKMSRSPEAKRDLWTRQHLMERSFARSKRFGFDRARWRGLWRVAIQEYLICALQNIQALLRYGGRPDRAVSARVGSNSVIFIAMVVQYFQKRMYHWHFAPMLSQTTV